ncbi:TolC family protein [Pseudomonas fluorescens]|uniref:Protein CyaE n=1 Tax=Pseudomonas fluorescens TaxID=294 RepID=A0A944DL91_PSEFL|nr:TolC family protein [Pseudomonas fluorescens]MBT2296414.1 TolC family protein [Pseudomonas fluorescens]MBT2308752.1 TolC family protein [Pseudomonas fluorescens]MBT2312740.1 TolC family protein [Pseudomonas fluorescens]MBT2317869.1 TolC family protein [Pseudomonas fluorescens]MBT2330053.1 TolC family protein [Pseudomonas fluorescens]
MMGYCACALSILVGGITLSAIGAELVAPNHVTSASSKASSYTGQPCAFGRFPAKLSLQETIERILCNDPKTRSAWAHAKAQAAQIGVSRSSYFPKLTGSTGMSTGRTVTSYEQRSELSREGHQRQVSNRLHFSWILFDSGHREAELRKSMQLLVAANANQDAVLQKSSASAAELYYGALAAQHSLGISSKVTSFAAENLDAAEARYRSGAAALSDLLQAKAAYSQASLNQIRDKGALRNATGRLALRMGLSPETAFELAGDLTSLPDTRFIKAIDELFQQAQQDHPALIAVRARIKATEAKLDESRAAGKPTLSVTADISHTRIDQSQMLNGDRRDRDRAVGLQLNIPLFDGFSRKYQIRSDLAFLEASKEELLEEQQRLSLELWENYQTLSSEFQRLDHTNKLITQSQQSLEVVQGRYRSGVGSMIELLNALNTYAGAEDQHINALTTWHTTRLRLSENLGLLGFWRLH